MISACFTWFIMGTVAGMLISLLLIVALGIFYPSKKDNNDV